MAVYFFDTSAAVKRYVQETGTGWVQSLLDPEARNFIYVVRLCAVELTSAVARRRQGGSIVTSQAASILSQFRQDLALRYRIIEITQALLSDATQLAEAHALRAYDAVQLAAANALHVHRLANGMKPAAFVSADIELNAVATALGLSVDNPNLHL